MRRPTGRGRHGLPLRRTWDGLSGPKDEAFAGVRCLAACGPRQTWQPNLMTTKLLLLSYHGISPPPRPRIDGLTVGPEVKGFRVYHGSCLGRCRRHLSSKCADVAARAQEGKPECLGRCLSPAALIALNCRGLDGLMEADGDQLSRGLPPRQPLRCIHFKYSLASLSVLFTKEPAAAGKGVWRRSWQRVKEGGSLAMQPGLPFWPSPGVGGSQSQYNSTLYMIYKAKHLSILFFVFIFLIISVMNDGSLYSKNNLQSIPTTSMDPPHSRMREIIPIFQVSKLRLRGNNWHHSCCSGLWAL